MGERKRKVVRVRVTDLRRQKEEEDRRGEKEREGKKMRKRKKGEEK